MMYGREGITNSRSDSPTLFLGNQLFHTRGNFLMFQHLTTFDLADQPLVVTHQRLDCFMHQRFSVASLLRGNTVKLAWLAALAKDLSPCRWCKCTAQFCQSVCNQQQVGLQHPLRRHDATALRPKTNCSA